ncbi:hypothetical protein BpHYR1_019533 [Brachionus plicatilis]|uniref:Uncharacterized protein n=1 Tax=Brachionus plicatilis TaxID=10195 RepID=A0A3M7PV36_BRAPC|nr:hypothetical protein BpHYR1_019533 [Brachionus plicatilis]
MIEYNYQIHHPEQVISASIACRDFKSIRRRMLSCGQHLREFYEALNYLMVHSLGSFIGCE